MTDTYPNEEEYDSNSHSCDEEDWCSVTNQDQRWSNESWKHYHLKQINNSLNFVVD